MTIGGRIKIARRAAQLSLRALAEEVGVSAQAISKYERDLHVPNSDMLLRLARALGVKIEFFFRTQQFTLSPPVYRKRASLPRKQEQAIQAHIQEWLERYLEIESFFPSEEMPRFAHPEGLVWQEGSLEDVERVALELRQEWKLGVDPIDSLVELLEEHGMKVGLVDAHEKFDACTFWVNGSAPVIAVNRDFPGDRQRFSIAHDLGHLVLGTDDDGFANRFAGALLVPGPVACRELGERRRTLSLSELHLLKHKYGLSMQGWIYRAKDLGIISESAFRYLNQRFRAARVHRREPGKPFPTEEPKRMERLVYRALAEDLISKPKAAELLSKPVVSLWDEETERYA
jgi:Zn-dependent peptidase ImmA (M78 family)